jgi:hypothetical protein
LYLDISCTQYVLIKATSGEHPNLLDIIILSISVSVTLNVFFAGGKTEHLEKMGHFRALAGGK